MQKLLIGCGVLIAVPFISIIVLLVSYGAAIESGYCPDSVAQPKGKIHARYIKELKNSKIIDNTEDVYFFSSDALFSILDDGALFTDKRVISYQTSDEKLEIQSADYQQVDSIEFQKAKDWGQSSCITVTEKDGGWFTLSVNNGSNMDDLFYKKLKAMWEASSKSAD